MKRRMLLASAAAVSGSAIAGCVTSGPSTPEYEESSPSTTEYEECSLSVIYADDLPSDVHHEVETAVTEGAYETDGELYLTDVMGPNTVYVRVDGSYLEPTIESDSGTTRLTFEESIPSHDRDGRLSFSNQSDENVAVSITVEYTPYSDELEAETLLDEEFDFGPGGAERLSDDFHRYGRYDAEAAFESAAETQTETWYVSLSSIFLGLSIEADERLAVDLTQLDYAYCTW